MSNTIKILGPSFTLPDANVHPLPAPGGTLYRVENHTEPPAWINLNLYDDLQLENLYATLGIPPNGSEIVQLKSPSNGMSSPDAVTSGQVYVIPIAFTH